MNGTPTNRRRHLLNRPLAFALALAALAATLLLAPSAGAQPPLTIDWGYVPADLRGRNGEQFTFNCAPNGSLAATVWGTDVYTDDSSVCKAAVHAGVIRLAQGGTVAVTILAGRTAYQGSTRNGVTTEGYGSWSGSFSVAPAGAAANAPAPAPASTSSPASSLVGQSATACKGAERYRFSVLSAGWGTAIVDRTAPAGMMWAVAIADVTSLNTEYGYFQGLVAVRDDRGRRFDWVLFNGPDIYVEDELANQNDVTPSWAGVDAGGTLRVAIPFLVNAGATSLTLVPNNIGCGG
jgi:hypothetical protein